jgi:F-type H+-transporting ATPase subunit a
VAEVELGDVWAVDATGVVVMVNALIVSVVLIALGAFLARGKLTSGVPKGRQLFGEFAVDFFIKKARGMSDGYDRAKIVGTVTPFLGTLFFFILISNLFVLVPIPVLNRPPTSFFSATLALALCAVIGNLVLAAYFKGGKGAVKHLFWPNPMQWVSEFTDVLSLSLRLFGNIGGEYMTLVLVAAVVPVGIPLILHALGLIPSFVQALVFTLLTASFLAGAIHRDTHKKKKAKRSWFGRKRPEPVVQS